MRQEDQDVLHANAKNLFQLGRLGSFSNKKQSSSLSLTSDLHLKDAHHIHRVAYNLVFGMLI